MKKIITAFMVSKCVIEITLAAVLAVNDMYNTLLAFLFISIMNTFVILKYSNNLD